MHGTFTKLRNGNWGLRVKFSATEQMGAGTTVTVTKSDGTRSVETVGSVVWVGDDKDAGGHKVALTTLVTKRGSGTTSPKRDWPGKDCPTCGSEPLDRNLHCWECGYTGRP
jgi:hypothetical protein